MPKLYLAIVLAITLMFSPNVKAQLNQLDLSYIPETGGAEIYDVLADRMGNIWMATHSGLIRYDGYELRHFYPDPNDSTTIGDILTYKLLEDRSGKIWIGCKNYISVYNPLTRSFINYDYLSQTEFALDAQAFILSITQDGNGTIYFGVASFFGIIASHALVYMDENEGRIKRFEYPDSLKIENQYGITSDPSGDVWITGENGIFRIDTSKKIHPVAKPDEEESMSGAILSDLTGKIWMGGDNSNLYVYDPDNGKYKSWSLENVFKNTGEEFTFMKMIIDSSDNIWISTNRGLVYFDRKKDLFETFDLDPEQKINQNFIYGLDFDLFGDLWYGTFPGGLVRYSKRTIMKSFTSDDNDKASITTGWAFKIIDGVDGSVWIATTGGSNYIGLTLLDIENGAITPFEFQPLSPGFFWSNLIAEQKPGEFLLKSNRGFYVFNANNKTFTRATLDPLLDSVFIFNIYRDSRDNEWYCSASGLYLKNKEGNNLRHYDLSVLPGCNITSNEVVNVSESNKHGLWVLTNNGLFLYDYKSDKIERLGYERAKGDVLMAQDINSFYEDSAGIAWIGTWQGGLSRFDVSGNSITTYTTSDGLPSMCIQGILADEKNKALWLSTFEGLSRFSIRDEQFNNFSLDDGIQGMLFADGAYLKTSKGLLIFGGNNGITVFDPDDIAKNSPPPKVFLTDFKIGNTSMDIVENNFTDNDTGKMKDIALTYDQNNISIDYMGIHYANPAKNKFAYKLENYDDDWREVGNSRTAYYYGLPPGNYTFRVKAANSNGVWNETGASMHIRITPPWWKTWWAYTFYGLLFLIFVFSLDRIQRRRILEKERTQAREKELAQAKEIEKAYLELKHTQAQLIQQEKMASLGELTAGIAHEIQNPLNFVNNFSEVSIEMIDEMKEEISKANYDEVTAIAIDIKQNLSKINHHGKRADAIVKGMLQHSRISCGVKEPTDINALADEYLRLAYHGLRAKDKSFNAVMNTDFDETVGLVNVIPQDVGRVILNLVTNAFYAVTEKKMQNGADYEPTVSLSTKKIYNKVEIKVSDNGNGIPQKVLEKIFQPFFTTKPPGQGTGLGLSLSYDIVKAHGGELEVETKEGAGSTFNIIISV